MRYGVGHGMENVFVKVGKGRAVWGRVGVVRLGRVWWQGGVWWVKWIV